MAKHGTGKIIIMAAAVLCLLMAVITALPSASGQTATEPSESSLDSPQDTQAGSAQTGSTNSANSHSQDTNTGNAEAQSTQSGKAEPANAQSDVIPQASTSQSTLRPVSTLRCIHYAEEDFFKSISAASSVGTTGSATSEAASEHSSPAGQIVGGVVPHHLVAADMIADFFRALGKKPPDTLVVIGPNHRRIGLSGLHTSTLDWLTPFGILETDKELTTALIDELKASQNDALMEMEHSISSLVPYINYYMPQTKILPILLHGNYSLEDSAKLGDFLARAMKADEGIAVIASIDFSHYLDTDTANRMDEITLQAVESRDTLAIIKMNNDNLDSPPSILSFLSAMDGMDAKGPDVIGHNNSYGITGISADYTTSYYTMLFRR